MTQKRRVAPLPLLPDQDLEMAKGPGFLDGGLLFRSVSGDFIPQNELLRLVCERIRQSADLLGLSKRDVLRIFGRHHIFEGEATARMDEGEIAAWFVQTHHLLHGQPGKGALRILFPDDLVFRGDRFRPTGDARVEVLPPATHKRWESAEEAQAAVKQRLREFMTAESVSMSLKCQAVGLPLSGSEGIILCAELEFDLQNGWAFLRPLLRRGSEHSIYNKRLLEGFMNSTAEVLTKAGIAAHDGVVHAAETNTTLTRRLHLQLPTSFAEGHLRALLVQNPSILIGDEDMTARLRELLSDKDYEPTDCALAREAARRELDYSILLPSTRKRLRNLVESLPAEGPPATGQVDAILALFTGSGDTNESEDLLFAHRSPIVNALLASVSAPTLYECHQPKVLSQYLRTLLDHPRKMMKQAVLKRLPPEKALPPDWYDRAPLLSREETASLASLVPENKEVVGSEISWRFAEALRILKECRGRIPKRPSAEEAPFWESKKETLDQALRALTQPCTVEGGMLVTPCDRLRFLTLPFFHESGTPKLGVVTRKPVDICGSELRPVAMAAGMVASMKAFLESSRGHQQGRFLEGIKVAVEGLGNAGKMAVRLLADEGAVIIGVSDSSGAVVNPGGLDKRTLEQIIEHKDRGLRLRSFAVSGASAVKTPTSQYAGLVRTSDPEDLKTQTADVLVLAAKPASINAGNVAGLSVRVICEVAGAAVTKEAKEVLFARGVRVMPDLMASAGGAIVSFLEMEQNMLAQHWDKELERARLDEYIASTYQTLTEVAAAYRVDYPTAADIIGLQRMHDCALYKERLEIAARKFNERIQAIKEGESVLIMADNDEDGVASAAIVYSLIASLNRGKERYVVWSNESLRSKAVLDIVNDTKKKQPPIKHVFVLDRTFPATEPGQSIIATLVKGRAVTIVDDHDSHLEPPDRSALAPVLETDRSIKNPWDLGILYVSPRTLDSKIPSSEFPSSMMLKEIAQELLPNDPVLRRINWLAAIGSFLDADLDKRREWLLFYHQFNSDELVEASRAVRTVTRVGGFENVVKAVAGIREPEALETNETWQELVAAFWDIKRRVDFLVHRIVEENRGKRVVSHFLTEEEIKSPTNFAGDHLGRLDLYHWLSEELRHHEDFENKSIILGQVVHSLELGTTLGVRIRSPRGVDLGHAILPEYFKSGGLPNTAITRIPLDPSVTPETQFEKLVKDMTV